MSDLKRFRKENNLTQVEFAEFLEVGQSFISQIEKGTRPIPNEYISKIISSGNFLRTDLLFTEISDNENISNEAMTVGSDNLGTEFDCDKIDNLNSNPLNYDEMGTSALANLIYRHQEMMKKEAEWIDRLFDLEEKKNGDDSPKKTAM